MAMSKTVRVIPRLMVVDTLEYSRSKQTLGLTLFSRSASAEFDKLVPDRKDLVAVLRHAREHNSPGMARVETNLDHIRHHEVRGRLYHLGDVLTEQAAYDFGYVQPHLETVAARIVETALPRYSDGTLTDMLREKSLISSEHTAISKDGRIHVITKRMARHGVTADLNTDRVDGSHPIHIAIGGEQGEEIPITVLGFYDPNMKRTYGFMTHVVLKS